MPVLIPDYIRPYLVKTDPQSIASPVRSPLNQLRNSAIGW